MVEHLPSMHKGLGLNPSTTCNRCGMHPRNPRVWEVKTRESAVQGHPQLQREFEANLGYLRP